MLKNERSDAESAANSETEITMNPEVIYKLYDYFRSSASFRVRIGLNLKKITYEQIPIHLLRDGGEQKKMDYLAVNPQGLVPALQLGNHDIITQSLAILEYVDEIHPEPALLPKAPLDRAYVRSLSLLISCDIHPLNNLRVLQYLKDNFQIDDPQKNTWIHHWITSGFEALEQHLISNQNTGDFCFGDSPTLADICLVPQYYNAKRFECSMNAFPTVEAIAKRCLNLSAFSKALPQSE